MNATFFTANFDDPLSKSFSNFTIFEFQFYTTLIIKLNQTIVAAFCECSKVVSSDFSVIKNISALLYLSSLPIKLICCLKSGFLIQFASLSLLQLVFNALKNVHSPIN